jgi:hypothetical protein
LCHPASVKKTVESIVRNPILDLELRRMIEAKLAVELPPAISPEACVMGWMRRTYHLPLMPVAHVMRADHPEGAGHADKGSEPDEKPFEPKRDGEASVNQQAMHANRMAGAECYGRQRQESRSGSPGRIEEDPDQAEGRMEGEPE